MAMSKTTIISSSKVKPRRCAIRAEPLIPTLSRLPVLVLCAIQACSARLGVDVKNVLPTPGVRRGIILHGTHAPFLVSRHGINRDTPQKSELFAALDFHAVHQGVQIRGISLGIELLLEGVFIRRVLVT